MSKESVKNLVKSVSFVLIFVLILYLLAPIFIPKENKESAGERFYTQKVFHGEENDTLNIFFVGNSDLYRSISPMQLYGEYGYTSFDAAAPCARMSDIYYMLKDFLSCQSPSLVVLETDGAFRSTPNYNILSSRLGSHLAYLSDFVTTAEDDLASEINHAFPVIGYHVRWKTFSFSDFTKQPDYTTVKDPFKGFILDGRVLPCSGNPHMEQTDKRDVIEPPVSLYMDKIVNLCRENNIDILLYEAPAVKSWNYSRHNGMSDYAEKNGLTFLDFNTIDEVGIDWQQDTKDAGEHMNVFGAQQCTAYMGKYISENYSIPVTKSSTWDEQYQNYLTALKKEEEHPSRPLA